MNCSRLLITFFAFLMCAMLASPAAAQKAGKDDPNRNLTAPEPVDEEQAKPAVAEFPASWYVVDPQTKKRYANWDKVEGKPVKPLRVDDWFGKPQHLEELEGKVIVVYFWSAECGPCLVDLAKTGKIADEVTELGAVFFAIHDHGKSVDRLPGLIRQFKIEYSIGVDRYNLTQREWEVRAHPMYVVIDSTGIVRVVGLKPERVVQLTKNLFLEKEKLTTPAAAPQDPAAGAEAQPADDAAEAEKRVEIPETWLEGTAQQRLVFDELLRKSPPAIESETWLNVEEPLSLENLRGKVVMLDFWATWCGPCRAAVPKTNDLMKKYKDDGLVIIGVCHPRAVELMPTVAQQTGIKYPVCADKKGAITASYFVNSFPDYYFIDRSGALRIADCDSRFLEQAIQALLSEPAPGKKTSAATTSPE